MKIWTVDAFTREPYTGNPAAVMVVEDFFPNMQRVAAEMNLSETAFVKPLGPGHYHIRWFTPAVEVALCGHATLAAAHVLFHHLGAPQDLLTFECASGTLSVRREADLYVMDFPMQEVTTCLDMTPFGEIFPGTKPQEAYQAHDDILLVFEKEEDVRALTPDFDRLKQIPSRGVIVSAPGNNYDCISRFFAPNVGVNEDPVCGSAHCKLAHYWSRRLGKSDLLAYQASARGGTLSIQVQGARVLLKGYAVTTVEGTWLGPV